MVAGVGELRMVVAVTVHHIDLEEVRHKVVVEEADCSRLERGSLAEKGSLAVEDILYPRSVAIPSQRLRPLTTWRGLAITSVRLLICHYIS
jgi:L-fucose isomerase-like protein